MSISSKAARRPAARRIPDRAGDLQRDLRGDRETHSGASGRPNAAESKLTSAFEQISTNKGEKPQSSESWKMSGC
jgi:hypothetical protein